MNKQPHLVTAAQGLVLLVELRGTPEAVFPQFIHQDHGHDLPGVFVSGHKAAVEHQRWWQLELRDQLLGDELLQLAQQMPAAFVPAKQALQF